ncbi:MAG: hypothetical protein HY659_01175 [Rhizobiales bacterium]|nr:hypothetical protein [Hyphomicrobiales bacterium]
MPGLDFATGTLTMPWWAALIALVLFGVIGVLAVLRSGPRQTLGAIARYAMVVIALILAAGLLEHLTLRDRNTARRALDTRAGELTARAVAAGSPLACLDGTAGEVVETACEKALFASPETIASAITYVSARLALLADFDRLGNREGKASTVISMLRSAAASDRFGLVAHLLSYRDNCTPAVCDAFGLIGDTSRVAANMRERTFDNLVDRYAATWHGRTEVIEKSPSTPTPGTPVATAPAVAPSSVHYDFPSAASIPPVSIMNAEPSGPPVSSAAEAEKTSPPTGRKPVATKRGDQKPGAPVSLVPVPPTPPAAANTTPGSAIR